MYFYIGFHLMLTMASVSLHELGTLGTTMSVEWILGPGFFMYLPPLRRWHGLEITLKSP